jgi:hypothetical protein
MKRSIRNALIWMGRIPKGEAKALNHYNPRVYIYWLQATSPSTAHCKTASAAPTSIPVDHTRPHTAPHTRRISFFSAPALLIFSNYIFIFSSN